MGFLLCLNDLVLVYATYEQFKLVEAGLEYACRILIQLQEH